MADGSNWPLPQGRPVPTPLERRLAEAIRQFRHVPALRRATALRATPEFEELCEAWAEFRDLYET